MDAFWREPTTGAFSCVSNPGDNSCDNGLLFTAEAYLLGIIKQPEFAQIANQYQVAPGLFCRHPVRQGDLTAQDDLLGIAASSIYHARGIYFYGELHGWKWGDRWLGRFPHFKPAIKAGAGLNLSLWDHFKLSLAFADNFFEKREETSGKLLLWVITKVIGNPWYVRLWRARMRKVYGEDWLHALMSVYFPARHPFHEASKGKE